MPRLSADVLDSKADDWTITDDGRDFGPTTSWPAPRIRADDRNPAIPESSQLTRSGLPDAYAFLRMKVDPVQLPIEPNYAPNVAVDDAMMLFDGQSISQPSSTFPTGKRDPRMGAGLNIDTDFPARRSGGGSPDLRGARGGPSAAPCEARVRAPSAGALRADLSTPVQERERNIQWSPRYVRRTLVRGAGMLHSPPGAAARGNGAMISDAGFRVDGRGESMRVPDSAMLLDPDGRRSGGGMPIEAGALIRDVAQGPSISLKGIPSYRVVPEPTISLEEDNPGMDRFEAGILRRFLARTDAGALDGFRDASGCAGIMNGIVFDGPNHDAGMPQSWYDVIDNTRNTIAQRLGAWGGKLITPNDVKALNQVFSDFIAHATDDEKWNRFGAAKNLTLRLLDKAAGNHTVASPTSRKAQVESLFQKLEAHINTQGGLLKDIGGAIGSVGSAIGEGALSVGKGAVAIGKGIATPVAALVTSPLKLTADIASGKNVFQSLKDTVKRDLSSVKEVAPYVQAAISLVPGVGAGVNAAISAGAALAQGQPITSALVAGLKSAMPGGPLAAQAFDTVYSVARGQNLSEAALQAVVNNLPGGDVAKQAAQTAIAVAKGQNLQQAALGLVKGAVLSGDVKIPGGDLATKAALDIASGKNVKDVALGAAKDNLMNFTRDKLSPLATNPMNGVGPRMLNTLKSAAIPTQLPREAQLVASALLKNPSLRSLPLSEVANRLNVATHVARAGAASVLQSVQRSGGSTIPMLAQAGALEQQIPFTATFDQMMSRVASRASRPVYSHNATTERAAQLRQHAHVFRKLQAQGLDAGALDPKLMPTIKQGSTGDAVVQWQKILGVTADGQFGPNTAAATKTFQQKHGLTADGIVGPNTWLAGLGAVISAPITPGAPPVGPQAPPPAATPVLTSAMPTIRMGSTGAPVKTWQAFLGIPADGQFGPQTDTATRAFQAKNGLTADGIVGPNTWGKAMSGTATPPPIISTPPITIPPIFPGGSSTTIPPIVISQPPPGSPPGTPPIITTGNPPGQPPAPPGLPPITTSPPGTPPVVLPPSSPPSSGGMKSAMVPVAVGLGLLLFVMSGSSKKLF
jgi:peptidoglycan hydrolase-like protein with peptidoglycan-binding domain